MRLPAIFMLARSLRGLLLAMCADHTTPSMQPWLASLRGIIKGTPPAPVDLMWSTFMGACVSQCVCTVFRCLELIPAQDDPLTFNLVSFGFLLYIHAYAQEFIPNAHVYFILAVRVFELLGMNTLLTVRHPPISRLAFTTVTGLLLSAHFLFVTIYTNEYPVLHSATRVIETLVVGIIALTIVLHALTMYLVDGSVRMDKLLRLRGTQPRPNDDFSLAVLKVGNACLQATQCSGLAREIGPLATPLHTYVEMYSSGRSQLEYGLDDMDVAELQGINGFDTEVRDIHVMLEGVEPELGSVVRGADKLRAGRDFAMHLANIALQMLRMIFSRISMYLPAPPMFLRKLPRYLRLFWHGTNGEARREERLRHEAQERAQLAAAQERALSIHQRRLHRRPLHASPVDEDLDPMELLALAEVPAADRTAFHNMLLTHLMRPDHAPPVTRRSYKALEAGSTGVSEAWATSAALQNMRGNDFETIQAASDRQTHLALLYLLQQRRQAQKEDKESERMRQCVVCCSEERYVLSFLLTQNYCMLAVPLRCTVRWVSRNPCFTAKFASICASGRCACCAVVSDVSHARLGLLTTLLSIGLAQTFRLRFKCMSHR